MVFIKHFGARGPGSRTNVGRLQIRVCIDEIFHLMTVKTAVLVFCSVYFTRFHYLVPVVCVCTPSMLFDFCCNNIF